MKYIVRKAFWDYEKEEKWLNEMSAKGMALSDVSWCRYVFTDSPNNEYVYRIELLENLPAHPESMAYIKFLEDSGVEYVASSLRWIYLRKKSSEGPFDIYSDIDSKIRHFKRISIYWGSLMFMELMIGLFNIVVGIVNLNLGSRLGNFSIGNIILGSSLAFLGLVFFRLGSPIRNKIKKLQQEKFLRE